VAPEICVEVKSWSNTGDELGQKRLLYAERGCLEYWLCDDDGQMTFQRAATGEKLSLSEVCPNFPAKLVL
jgi:Uma2 family endonuclease